MPTDPPVIVSPLNEGINVCWCSSTHLSLSKSTHQNSSAVYQHMHSIRTSNTSMFACFGECGGTHRAVRVYVWPRRLKVKNARALPLHVRNGKSTHPTMRLRYFGVLRNTKSYIRKQAIWSQKREAPRFVSYLRRGDVERTYTYEHVQIPLCSFRATPSRERVHIAGILYLCTYLCSSTTVRTNGGDCSRNCSSSSSWSPSFRTSPQSGLWWSFWIITTSSIFLSLFRQARTAQMFPRANSTFISRL